MGVCASAVEVVSAAHKITPPQIPGEMGWEVKVESFLVE